MMIRWVASHPISSLILILAIATKRVNYHIIQGLKQTTFQLFHALEYRVSNVLKSLERPSPSCKADLIKKVITDDDVQFHWLIAIADFEIDDMQTHDALLKMIVDLYVTIRGFSKANVWLEYKQSTKRSTQRTKSLCRELYDNTTGSRN